MLLALLLQAAATAAPPPPELLQEPVTPAGRAALRAVLQWPQECEDQHQAAARLLEIDEGRVRFLDLGQRHALVEVACARGAYQEARRYFLLDLDGPQPEATALSLPSRALDDDGQWQPVELPEIAGDASFDKKRRTLTVFARARGLGDCGTRGTWRVDVAQKRLVLVELLGRDCDAEPDQAPPFERWPRLFPPARPQ